MYFSYIIHIWKDEDFDIQESLDILFFHDNKRTLEI